MKILLDKEFKEIKETIEMYKDKYNEAIENYYKCDKFAKNTHNKYTEKLEENFFLQNKINKALKFIDGMFDNGDDVKTNLGYVIALDEISKVK